jgi:hypothetical protein
VNEKLALSHARRSLHARLLGEAFDELPPAVRDLHDGATRGAFCGLAKVERGDNLFARLAAWLIGFPNAGSAVSVNVTIEASDDREIWRRNFAGRRFQSELNLDDGPNGQFLVERFGAARVGLALTIDKNRLRIVPCRTSVFGILLPDALTPRGETYESEINGQFSFHVEIILPLVGLVVRYQGQLARV